MPDGYSNSAWLAQGVALEGQDLPVQLFTAEDDIKTSAALYKTNQTILFGTILAKDATGDLVQWAPAAVDTTAVPVGVAAADMNTTAGGYNADTMGPYYVSACFNPELLVWPAALAASTHDAQMAALEAARAPFRIKPLL